MSKSDVDRIIGILSKPDRFQSLDNLKSNLRAYGELEFIEGYYTGLFKQFKELCDEVHDLQDALELNTQAG